MQTVSVLYTCLAVYCTLTVLCDWSGAARYARAEPGHGQDGTKLAAGFLTCYMAAGFPSVYCQVRAAGSRLSFHLLADKGQLVADFLQLKGGRFSFHILPGKGQLAAGFHTSRYMATGFTFIYCQARGSWQQAFLSSAAR
jgi:hypothetical protein